VTEMIKMNLSDAYWFQEGPGIRNWQFTHEGVKLLNVGNIEKNGNINLAKTDRHISQNEANGKYKHFLCDEGDLVIASSGISIDDDGYLRTRGAFIEQKHLPLCINTSTIRFKSLKSNNLGYLKHWLQSAEFRKQITKLVTGSAQLNFGPSHLKQIKIALPSIHEQKRISCILDKTLDVKSKREQALAKLDELAESLFHQTCSFALNKFKLSDICEIVSGATPKTEKAEYWNGDICWVTPAELSKLDDIFIGNTARKITPEGLKSCAASLLPVNSVLFSSRAPIGHIAINSIPMATNQGFKSFIVNSEIVEPIYLYYWLNQNREMLQNMGVGATFKELSKSLISSVIISLPSIETQRSFVKSIAKIREVRAKNKAAIRAQAQLITSLQQQIFSAEISNG